jgi:hypothetical protein
MLTLRSSTRLAPRRHGRRRQDRYWRHQHASTGDSPWRHCSSHARRPADAASPRLGLGTTPHVTDPRHQQAAAGVRDARGYSTAAGSLSATTSAIIPSVATMLAIMPTSSIGAAVATLPSRSVLMTGPPCPRPARAGQRSSGPRLSCSARHPRGSRRRPPRSTARDRVTTAEADGGPLDLADLAQ